MNIINVNEERDLMIEFQGLENMDVNYTFYYDETNNGRKFHLADGRFNISIDQNFILGGIVYEGQSNDIEPTELFQRLDLQKTINEVKFKHIASGDFINVLKSKKINLILKWISSKKIYLHYTNLNPLYFGIVDIIDSAIVSSETTKAFDIGYANLVKNELYIALNKNIEKTEEIFYQYGYPSIDEDKIVEFLDDIIEIIEPYRYIQKSHLGIETAIQILKASRRNKSMPFIQDENKHVLMQDYSPFYMQPLRMFKNSMHYFDREDHIEKILKQYKFVDEKKQLDHYSFIDSKSNKFIQLSDIMMGLLGKLYAFIRRNSEEDIKYIISNLGELEKENLNLLNEITWKSHEKCKGFLLKITSDDERIKEQIVLP
ncbi:DUF3800 domain-containing protein [Paenibacillus sp. FSL H7-0943]|uniref:DUF3800 domain-containing protein n=1 Tax=Paenibacillus sp. FSL H7-0943 TaxID=2954739 RepID=UPI0030D46FDF